MRVKKFDSINVVPFIDIMLVLLVIVLTTATFVAKGIIPIDLSNSISANKTTKPQTLDIKIKNSGEIYFNDQKTSKDQIDQTLLKYKKDTSISIASDKDTKIDTFIQTLDILKTNNYTNIGIVTKVNK